MSYFLQNGQSKKNSKLVEKYLLACQFGNQHLEEVHDLSQQAKNAWPILIHVL